jgi:uncharacterized protein YcbX
LKQSATVVGMIAQLWRYPLKSMGGERVDASILTNRGILGDRTYALLDVETGHIVSAKHPRKWAAVLTCRAEYITPPSHTESPAAIRITLPDNRTITSDDPDIDRILSDTFGRPVKLLSQAPQNPTREANRADVEKLLTDEDIKEELMAQAAPDGTFFDHAPLHLLTTATLTKLTAFRPNTAFDVRRFRPNIGIAPSNGQVDFVENEWLGKSLLIGDSARLNIFDPTARCVITTLPQADLPHDLDVLRTVAQHTAAPSITAAPGHIFPAVVGVYGLLDVSGSIRVGDKVLVTNEESP